MSANKHQVELSEKLTTTLNPEERKNITKEVQNEWKIYRLGRSGAG